MNNMTINFNGQNYIAKYNEQTGYYEVNLEAPEIGGIYEADITFTDLLGQSYEETQIVQILAREKIKIETNTVTMWIFDYRDFKVKDIVEISDYEITIDEETNANSIIKVLKKTTAESDDIVMIKKNNEAIYFGIIDKVQNEDGKILYEYTLKYITNMFNEKVVLNRNIETEELKDGGYYRFRSVLSNNKVIDVTDGSLEDYANVQLWELNDTLAQKWKAKKVEDNLYSLICVNSEKAMDVENEDFKNNTNIQQYNYWGGTAQKWSLKYLGNGHFKIKSAGGEFYISVEDGSTENGSNIKIYENIDGDSSKRQEFVIEELVEQKMWLEGIEDFIAETIKENFIENKDSFVNRDYLEIRVKTHTKIKTSVSNVTDNLYDLHTWMTNCTQLYNIIFTFYIENKKLILEIENKSLNKELIDVNAQPISNYTEVFETTIISKVEVLTNTLTYYLYLLNDRTTTTDSTDVNRAKGKTERVFTANFEDAPQKALDTIKSNTYNHNITFKYLDRFIKVGTPITIKTKESLIYDTYISAIKITQNKFVEYTCGNIRIKFIDKLLKERRNK